MHPETRRSTIQGPKTDTAIAADRSMLMRVAVPERLRLMPLLSSCGSWGEDQINQYQDKDKRSESRSPTVPVERRRFAKLGTMRELLPLACILAWHLADFSPGDPFLMVGKKSIGVGLGEVRMLREKIVNRWPVVGLQLTPPQAFFRR